MNSELNKDFVDAVAAVSAEKGIDPECIFLAIEDALKAAYKKKYGDSEDVRITMDRNTGEIHLFGTFMVVDDEPGKLEITVAEANAAAEEGVSFEVGDMIEREVYSDDFGRMAALTAKQVVVQRLREAEQTQVDRYYKERQSNVVTGFVQRKDRDNVYLDLGKVDGVLLKSEQIPGEHYDIHSRKKVYILDVRRTRMGPQVMVSRTHPGLLKKLLEVEVPEIGDGTVKLMSVAREPGARSKIAVYAEDKEVDAVGACVGPRGSRIQNIVNELNGEKIDVVAYSENPAEYVANSLSPSKVVEAKASEEEKICRVVVPDFQLSLAIGKEGQNARLAAKLTGWKIDIKSETQAAEETGKEVVEKVAEAVEEQPVAEAAVAETSAEEKAPDAE